MSTVARFEWEDREYNPDTGEYETIVHKNDIRWDPENGGFAMCDGKEEYAQTIAAAILTVRGEIVTMQNYGIPYFTTVFTSRNLTPAWARAVRRIVLGLPFVRNIEEFTYEFDNKRKVLKYYLAVSTKDGETVELTQE